MMMPDFRLYVLVRRLQGYIWIAFALFIVGSVTGDLFASSLQHMIAPMYTQLRQEALTLHQDTPWELFWSLFSNNLRVSLIMIIGGIAVAIVPVAGVFGNGLLVGYVLRMTTIKLHASTSMVFVAGILPHGIFEIPAYLLASALGIQIGWKMLASAAGRNLRDVWGGVFHDIIPVIFWVAAFLFVAAFIETNITPALLHAAVGK